VEICSLTFRLWYSLHSEQSCEWQFSFSPRTTSSWNNRSINFKYCVHRKYADALWHAVSCVQKYCSVQIVCLCRTYLSSFSPFSPQSPHQNIQVFQYQSQKMTASHFASGATHPKYRGGMGGTLENENYHNSVPMAPGCIHSYVCLVRTIPRFL
jgi:hypothetical protein